MTFHKKGLRIESWIIEDYPIIKKQAALNGAEIIWGDETKLRFSLPNIIHHTKQHSSGLIPSSHDRKLSRVLRASNSKGTLHFMVFKAPYRESVVLEFLRRLLRHLPKKLYLIVDYNNLYKSKRVKLWLNKNMGRIQLYTLPRTPFKIITDEHNEYVTRKAIATFYSGYDKISTSHADVDNNNDRKMSDMDHKYLIHFEHIRQMEAEIAKKARHNSKAEKLRQFIYD